MTQTIELVVRLTLVDDVNIAEVLQEMDYSFTHEGAIVDTEIVDVITEV